MIIAELGLQPGKAAELASQLLTRVGPAQACHIRDFVEATPEQQKGWMHFRRLAGRPDWSDMADKYDKVDEDDFNVDIYGDSASRNKKKLNSPPEQTNDQASDSASSSSEDDDGESVRSEADIKLSSKDVQAKGALGKSQSKTMGKKRKKKKNKKKEKRQKSDSDSSSESSDSGSSSEDDNPFSTSTNNTMVTEGQESMPGNRMDAIIRNTYSNFAEVVNKSYPRKNSRKKAECCHGSKRIIRHNDRRAHTIAKKFAGQALTKCLRKPWSDSRGTRLAQNSDPFNAVVRNICEQYDSETSLIQAEKRICSGIDKSTN